MYKFQEIYIHKAYYDDSDKNIKFIFHYNFKNFDFIFNFDNKKYSNSILIILNSLDKNWKENLENYITKNFVQYENDVFCFPVKEEITEEEMFYLKLKLPLDHYERLFSISVYNSL